jgi:O-antigen ligase
VGSAPGLFAATGGLLILSILLGGGTRPGLWSDAVVQIASLVLLGFLVYRQSGRTPSQYGPDDWLIIAVIGAVILLLLFQMLPLPPAIWTRLPGRGLIEASFKAADIDVPWMGISLDPQATWRSLASIFPAIAVFWATAQLEHPARRSLSVLLIGLGIVSVLLGLAQLMQGPGSNLRFFPVTNLTESVGFFANRNHYAALLYSLIPIAAAWVVGFLFDRRPERYYGIAVCILVYAVFILGLGMARSRAGILLAIVAALASLLMAANNEDRFAKHGLFVVGGATLAGIVLISQYAFFGLQSRLDSGLLADFRLVIVRNTWKAISAFQPVGSGFGTFEDVYRIFENSDSLRPMYVNQAHNDWLQLWLEGGWLGLAILLAFLIWFARATLKAWRSPAREGRVLDRALAQAASVAIVLLLMHSAMDYPLRTTAMMAIFSFLLAFLMPAPSARKGVQRPSNPTPVPHQHSDTRRNHRRRQRLSSHRV